LCKLKAAQLHGEESPTRFDRVRPVVRIKSFRVLDESDIALCRRYRADAYLLDAFVPGCRGGTGTTFNWALARLANEFGPIILAGGLTPENVEEAIRIARPYCVDVASGIESAPGVKDKEKMAAFIRRAKAMEV
jgi:phosphoribosylanthranilate isomerase